MNNKINENRTENNHIRTNKEFYTAVLTSITKVIIVQPFDFLRYRIQSSFSINYKISYILKNTATVEGIKVFYKAFTATAVGVFANTFFFIYFYQLGKNFLCYFKYFSDLQNDLQDRFNIESEYIKYDNYINKYKLESYKIALYSALGGFIAGFFTTLITLPTDNIRVRIQSMQNINNSKLHLYTFNKPKHVIYNIYNNNGIRGFYKAFTIAQIRECSSGFLYFGIYDFIKDRKRISILNKNNSNNNIELPGIYTFLYGSLSGLLNWSLTLPFDHVKTKLISDCVLTADKRKFTGTLDCFNKTYNSFGLKGFYSGYSIAVSRAFVVNGAMMAVFEKCNKIFK